MGGVKFRAKTWITALKSVSDLKVPYFSNTNIAIYLYNDVHKSSVVYNWQASAFYALVGHP